MFLLSDLVKLDNMTRIGLSWNVFRNIIRKIYILCHLKQEKNKNCAVDSDRLKQKHCRLTNGDAMVTSTIICSMFSQMLKSYIQFAL